MLGMLTGSMVAPNERRCCKAGPSSRGVKEASKQVSCTDGQYQHDYGCDIRPVSRNDGSR